ncbi:SufB/SufD family protein [Beijerinckia indica]|uniref:FeS assembly protein SufD n=1 Tax=Beijerinckia indica subsp. indica (strain ATCC 9039 / DSM 1715 / NCIMB 8712) TaxID=395963 RepID=B2IBN7_BEII9|nr:SufD family Fe-S cluster assembly protein [Beijerinckia indica]ACB93759.1 FeS assembly protein SufD [Beijerinckia indica subsp. indica ATCC 9039]
MSAQIIPSRTPAETTLVESFGAVKATLPGTADVAKLREENFAAFVEAGLPHRRVESWHYTDLRTIMREALPLAPVPTPAALEGLRKDVGALTLHGTKLVLVDGAFVPELSDTVPAGVTVHSLASVLTKGPAELLTLLSGEGLGAGDAIVALNAAMMQDGIVVEVAPGAVIAEPLNLIYATASAMPVARFSRSLVAVGAKASVTIAESSLGEGGRSGQTNGCLIFSVGDEAKVNHTTQLTGSLANSIRIDTFMVSLGAKVKFDSFALVSGAGLTRRQIFLRFNGEEAEAALRGASLLRGREYADTTLFVEHLAPSCVGRELFKYILDEESVGVFQGKIHVAPEAQHTDGKMLSKALLLTDGVAMNNKPELEIFADDVACAHGATCGGLSEEQIFYLQARGLPYKEAEALLLEAFAAELVDELEDEKAAENFRSEISTWLAGRTTA